uniref:Uncharacterized protein n=1 Tax=Arundo donax TaxID=35708 RepID=A0A0A9EEH4_ARUDO
MITTCAKGGDLVWRGKYSIRFLTEILFHGVL